MTNSHLTRFVWKLSLPIILVEATETFDHLIDTLFLARVGITELGAIAVADSVLLLFLVPALALVHGLQVLTARRAGQRRPEAVGEVFNQGLLWVLLVGTFAALVLKFFSSVVTQSVVESPAIGAAVDGYLQIDAFSIPLAGVTFACGALLTSLGNTRALIPATIILVVTDIILNYVFIFGKFGCPALGMRGAAVGSIGAELAAVLFLVAYIWNKFGHKDYGFFRFRKLDHRTTRLLGALSAPIAFQSLVQNLRWFVFFLIIERAGAQTLAIANIAYTVLIVLFVPTEGFAEATCSLVSRYVGKNRARRIGQVLYGATRGAIFATIPMLAVAFFAPNWLVTIFSPETDLVSQSNASLRVVALTMLIAIPGELWLTAVIGTGDTLASLCIESVLTVLMLGMTYVAAIKLAWPMSVVWISLPIAWLIGWGLSYGWIRSGIWRRVEL